MDPDKERECSSTDTDMCPDCNKCFCSNCGGRAPLTAAHVLAVCQLAEDTLRDDRACPNAKQIASVIRRQLKPLWIELFGNAVAEQVSMMQAQRRG